MERKILPAFDNIKNEAGEVEREAFENPGVYIDPEYYDSADAAENAFEKGLEYYQWMNDMLQGIINLFSAGLYHLFEQQLLLFHRKVLLGIVEDKNIKLLNLKEAKTRLSQNGIIVEEFDSWPQIDELRLLANVVKHADGTSAGKLRTKRPDLFHKSKGLFAMEPVKAPIFTPMTGESLYVPLSQFMNYAQSVKAFWSEMCTSLEEQRH